MYALAARALPVPVTTQLLSAYRQEKEGKEPASSARVASFSQDLEQLYLHAEAH